jgi:hypothetical protein
MLEESFGSFRASPPAPALPDSCRCRSRPSARSSTSRGADPVGRTATSARWRPSSTRAPSLPSSKVERRTLRLTAPDADQFVSPTSGARVRSTAPASCDGQRRGAMDGDGDAEHASTAVAPAATTRWRPHRWQPPRRVLSRRPASRSRCSPSAKARDQAQEPRSRRLLEPQAARAIRPSATWRAAPRPKAGRGRVDRADRPPLPQRVR